MNRVRLAIAVLAAGALAAGLSYWRNEANVDSHRQARQLVVHYTLSRADAPIVILGDSLTEASTLPRTVCGRAIVNAGLNGASTASDLGTWLIEALEGRRVAAIVVALGTNDALLKRSSETFAANYQALLTQLAGVTDRLTVLAIPAIDVKARVSADLQTEVMKRIEALNAALPEIANKGRATFIALSPMPSPHTIDGVHLDNAGYAAWDEAVLKGASSACNQR